ncbi:hypothetical protein ACR77J_11930 [Tissierella praeacuta]|uniref:hypothetical protein n=1 Tax=Tissierella praeacuta TaxID=43131 RepID=UPI001043F92C|nr:hypothetical protein [Tissierella praeacuta]TCU72834.1 hypothetical protein EV204_105170 [Tissierella praeacuta]
MSDKFGVPTDEQLAKINKLAKRTLSKDEVFVFPNKLAGDMIIPERNVQLTKELLDVFSSDANKGVSLLLDHSWSPDGFWGLGGRPKMAMSYGRTFDSRYGPGTEEGETISLIADHYMARGIELDGIKTDDLITSIEAGTLFDSSIGFSYGKATCSVCGKNYRKYDECKHIAGRTYEVEGDDGVTRNQFCYIKAEPPGFLMENSLVFDGAYPGAGIMSKAGDIVENEKGTYQIIDDMKDIDPLKPIVATYSERVGLLTMVKKTDHKKLFKGATVDDGPQIMDGNGKVINLKGGENSMNENLKKMIEAFGIEYKEGETKSEDVLSQLAEKWDATVKRIKASVEPLKIAEGVEELEIYMTQDQVSEKLGTELSADEVLKLAKEGQEYRKSLSDEAIAMGVRAMGNDFPKETWENSFANMDTKAIKDIMATWELQANASIPAGRQTDPAAGQGHKLSIPDAAFKVGK